MHTLTIRVKEVIGPICMDSDAGATLFGLITEALQRGDSVRVDFAGVTLTGPFLMDAIGSLHGTFQQEDLDKRLQITGLDEIHEVILRDVQRKAILFFSSPPALQEELAGIAVRAAEWMDLR